MSHIDRSLTAAIELPLAIPLNTPPAAEFASVAAGEPVDETGPVADYSVDADTPAELDAENEDEIEGDKKRKKRVKSAASAPSTPRVKSARKTKQSRPLENL